MNKLIFIAFLIVTATSCSKKAGDYNPDFIGHWRTEAYSLNENSTTFYRNEIIIEKKDGAYRQQCSETCEPYVCSCSNDVTGTPTVNDSRTLLKIGSANAITLSIDKEPYRDANDAWKMDINGYTYTKL